MKRSVSFVAAMLAVLSISCSAEQSRPKSHPYTIVATTGMVADIVRQVAGDKATVKGLIGEGVDPHLFKPTRGDIAALTQADLVFYSGLMLEGKMADALIKIGRGNKKVFAVTEIIDEKSLLEVEDGHFDPHVWMDVTAWGKTVDAVAKALAEFDTANASHYQANAQRYAKQLQELDAYARKALASIPEKQRVLITAHDAFNYFGRAYSIRVEGIQGISTESEAGLERINKLIDDIVQNNVRAVFVETSVSDKNVKALVEGARARGHTLSIGGTLFSDAMGAAGTYEGTYIGMIDHNVTTITRALGGQAPEKGLSGKLGEKK